MPRAKKGGAIPPDGRAPGAGPGARSDLSRPAGTQAIRTPTDLPYGQAKQIQQAQQAQRLPDNTQMPAAAPPAAGGGPAGMMLPPLGLDSPTQRPGEAVTAGAQSLGGPPPDASLAFKVDALRYLSSLPFAGPEVTEMLRKATFELDEAQHTQMTGPAQPGLPLG